MHMQNRAIQPHGIFPPPLKRESRQVAPKKSAEIERKNNYFIDEEAPQ